MHDHQRIERLSRLSKQLLYLGEQMSAWRLLADAPTKGSHVTLYTGRGQYHVTNHDTLRRIAFTVIEDLSALILETSKQLQNEEPKPSRDPERR